ncbi:MAG TPA: hydrogenase maturation nickel metallochaperone HypA [Anaeromyxobacteraceae bacterium]|nr:hydrogenase maturation nickel metallochaperone HypA [Anaeromyxobacteraceae bacterium]
MHEYSLIQSLVGRVEAEARARGAVAVHRVVVSVGELSGVDPDLLRTAYHTFRAGTGCERAELDLRRVVAAWACPACGRRLERGAPLACPECGRPAELPPGADEILLERIEMEVP